MCFYVLFFFLLFFLLHIIVHAYVLWAMLPELNKCMYVGLCMYIIIKRPSSTKIFGLQDARLFGEYSIKQSPVTFGVHHVVGK